MQTFRAAARPLSYSSNAGSREFVICLTIHMLVTSAAVASSCKAVQPKKAKALDSTERRWGFRGSGVSPAGSDQGTVT